jgi:hypothetical protein
MRRTVQIGLILSMILVLTACGKESAFKSAINKELEDKYQCLKVANFNISDLSALRVSDIDTLRQNMAVIVQTKKNGQLEPLSAEATKDVQALDALVKVGLLKKTQETQQATKWNGQLIDDKFYVMDLYNLTDAGQKTVKGKNFLGRPRSFCYAHLKVDKILNYIEQDSSERKVVEVKYSYKYTDVASWAKDDAVKAAFPEIEETLNGPDNVAVTVLIKGDKGWDTHL